MAPRIRYKRRSRDNGSLTAAAKKITNPGKTFKNVMGNSDASNWQEQAWHFLDTIGELRYYVSWRSASVSRCRLIASELDPETGKPTGECSNDAVNRIVKDIAGGSIGQSQMLKRLTVFLTAPGDGFVAMIVRDPSKTLGEDATPLEAALAATMGTSEEWVTLSREEIRSRGQNELQLALDDGTFHLYDPDTDMLFRVWNPHPRRSQEADSPVRAALSACAEIERTTATIDNASKSRLVGNGIVFVPQEMSLPAQSAPTAELESGIPGGSVEGGTPWAPATTQDLQDLLYEVATTAYKDQNSMAAFLPIIASVPGEWTKNVTHLKFDSTVSDTALKTRDSAIRRLAMSLDVAPERLLGMGANSNHWSAWAIGEDDVKIHIIPVLETIAAAMTQFILRPALEAEGIDPDLYTVYHDTTGLTQDPDRKQEAKDAFDRGAMSREALLSYLGFDDTDGYDLTTREGWIAIARDKAADDITLLPMLAELIGAGVENMKDATPPPVTRSVRTPETIPVDAETEPEEPNKADEEGDGGTDKEVTAAAYGLAKLCVSRALELANKRRMSRADQREFRKTPAFMVHTKLPAVVEDTRPLIDGWATIADGPTLIRAGFDPTEFHRVITSAADVALRTSSPAVLLHDELRKAIL